MKKILGFGPTSIVVAAFIGPGTLTVCTVSGATSGLSLLWGILISMFVSIVLLEMVSRITIATNKGIEENFLAIQPFSKNTSLLSAIITIVFSWVILYYTTGIFVGIQMGLMEVSNATNVDQGLIFWVIFILICFLIWKTSLASLHRVFILSILAILILASYLLFKMDLPISKIAMNLFNLSVTKAQTLTLISMITITVVPYSLLMFAYLLKGNYQHGDLKEIRIDIIKGILLGGFICFAMVIISSNLFFSSIENVQEAGQKLIPFTGHNTPIILGIILILAGITSALTSSFTLSILVKQLYSKNKYFTEVKANLYILSILLLGAIFSIIKSKPVFIFITGQLINGLLIPILSIIILLLINRRKLVKVFRNKWHHNIIAILVIIICVLIGLKNVFSVLNIL